MTKTDPEIGHATHRTLAVDLFNVTWTLLKTEDRTPAEDEDMVHAAHASLHHWGIVGTSKNHARGEWQIARVYAVLKRDVSALHYARLYMDACVKEDFGPFDLAFAHEGLARAIATAEPKQAMKHIEEARRIGKGIEESEDQTWLHTNLDEIAAMIDAH